MEASKQEKGIRLVAQYEEVRHDSSVRASHLATHYVRRMLFNEMLYGGNGNLLMFRKVTAILCKNDLKQHQCRRHESHVLGLVEEATLIAMNSYTMEEAVAEWNKRYPAYIVDTPTPIMGDLSSDSAKCETKP